MIGFQAWNKGDTQELRKWLDWGFSRHYFVSNGGMIGLFLVSEVPDPELCSWRIVHAFSKCGFFKNVSRSLKS
ncbi:hypothetical protein CMI48_01450 [Candidatus Pacearchaeota archaeon]|nr:hypothetical protein [Candidatus Pacearchaeota archaeon]